MESRGGDKSSGRPAISRRSCDPCRSRKIGCDRKTPCANCVSARLDCTHSAITSTAAAPRQRVLISAQYEQKIDDIAKGIDGIKLMLQGVGSPADTTRRIANTPQVMTSVDPEASIITRQQAVPSCGEPLFTYSAHIIDFVKTVLEARNQEPRAEPASENVISSLKDLVQMLEKPSSIPYSTTPAPEPYKANAAAPLPPLEAAVAVLRWAKDHEHYSRVAWLIRILPLDRVTEICRSIYFAVDDYNDVDFILANGFLSHLFAEHVVVSGLTTYKEYCLTCRTNLHRTLARLPLLIPARMESVAALAIGTFHTLENSKVTMAWRFISTASEICQTLGYHRSRTARDQNNPLRAAQESLFWTVYRMEKGLALRLSRPSTIRDSEITLPRDPNEPRYMSHARLQGRVYDQLYSPAGLAQPEEERGAIARGLAEEGRQAFNETYAEASSTIKSLNDAGDDSLRALYIYCELVCQSSLLALILRAVPAPKGSPGGVTHECIAVARDTLRVHEECIESVKRCKNDPFMVTRYINWAILNLPFVSFSILFTRTISVLDMDDLNRLDRFAESLTPLEKSQESATHPHHLYKLLCQAARLHVNSAVSSMATQPGQVPSTALVSSFHESLDDFDLVQLGIGQEGGGINDTWGGMDTSEFDLGDWYYGNQELMRLLDEDIRF